MSNEDEALVRRLFREGSDTPLAAEELRAMFAPDFLCHGPPEINHGHDDGRFGLEKCMFGDAFDGLRFQVHGLTSAADRVTARFSASGTQIGTFFGREPGEREASFSGVATYRVHDGVIREAWGTLTWS